MKSRSKLKTMILASLLTAMPSLAIADRGGAGPGGGSDIESNFKAKELKVFGELAGMSKSAKDQLKFDPDRILANLSIPNRFAPLCATGATLDFIVKQKKMAYVGAPGTDRNVISLDCRPDKESEWLRLFKSNTDGDILFFVHEAVRNDGVVVGDATEDDYGASSSYLNAKRTQDKIMSRELMAFLYPNKSQNSKCSLTFNRRKSGEVVMKLWRRNDGDNPEFAWVLAAQLSELPTEYNKADEDPLDQSGTAFRYSEQYAKILAGDPATAPWLYQNIKKHGCRVTTEAQDRVELERMGKELIPFLYPTNSNANGEMKCWVQFYDMQNDGKVRMYFYINPNHEPVRGYLVAKSDILPEGYPHEGGGNFEGRGKAAAGDPVVTPWIYENVKKYNCLSETGQNTQVPGNPNLKDTRQSDQLHDKQTLQLFQVEPAVNSGSGKAAS